jgi:hypothetical protein
MADVDTQVQRYASWLAARADEHAAGSPGSRPDDVPVGRDGPTRRRGRLVAPLSVAAAVVALVVVLAIVARPDDAHAPVSSTPATDAPTPTTLATSTTVAPTTGAGWSATVVAEPDTVAAGETVELRFTVDTVRGVAWHMTPAGTGAAQPMYLLIAAADGFDCDTCPAWYGRDEDWAWPDIGLGGTGPDTVVIPDVAAPGAYELCMASSEPSHCLPITVTAPAASTTTVTLAEAETMTAPFDVPSGSIVASEDDLFVLHADGDLYLHRSALAGGGEAERLVDLTDPRAPVAEGPGPNVVDDVAGLVDGSLVYGDCCEPVAGNLVAVPAPGADPEFISYGYGPTLDPGGTRLAGANDFAVWVADLGAGTSTSRSLNVDLTVPHLTVVDVVWTADSDRIVVLAFDDDGYVLMPFRGDASLAPLPTVRLDLASGAGTSSSLFAGVAPSGEIVVVTTPAGATELRYLDPTTFEEDVSLRRPLRPEHASSVRIAPDGGRLLWVVDGTLWYEPAGEAARVVATDVSAAWFVGTTSTP